MSRQHVTTLKHPHTVTLYNKYFMSIPLTLLDLWLVQWVLSVRCSQYFTVHTWSTRPNRGFYLGGVFISGSGGRMKCLSWTGVEPSRITITISQGTISAFRKEPLQIMSDTRKMATLLLCCRSYRTSWRFFLSGRRHLHFCSMFWLFSPVCGRWRWRQARSVK